MSSRHPAQRNRGTFVSAWPPRHECAPFTWTCTFKCWQGQGTRQALNQIILAESAKVTERFLHLLSRYFDSGCIQRKCSTRSKHPLHALLSPLRAALNWQKQALPPLCALLSSEWPLPERREPAQTREG